MGDVKNKFYLFLIENESQLRLENVHLNLVELPDIAILCEPLDKRMELDGLPAGAKLELVRFRRQSREYEDGVPVVRFENCTPLRTLIRPRKEQRKPNILPQEQGLELVVVMDCYAVLL